MGRGLSETSDLDSSRHATQRERRMASSSLPPRRVPSIRHRQLHRPRLVTLRRVRLERDSRRRQLSRQSLRFLVLAGSRVRRPPCEDSQCKLRVPRPTARRPLDLPLHRRVWRECLAIDTSGAFGGGTLGVPPASTRTISPALATPYQARVAPLEWRGYAAQNDRGGTGAVRRSITRTGHSAFPFSQ